MFNLRTITRRLTPDLKAKIFDFLKILPLAFIFIFASSGLGAKSPLGQPSGTLFLGGSGFKGAYIQGIKLAMANAGISYVHVFEDKAETRRIFTDALSVLWLREQTSVTSPQTFKGEGNQFNLVGYSVGALLSAQYAIKYAEEGYIVDNLVLIGAPISKAFLLNLKSQPNIKSVHVLDLTAYDDRIKAGMNTVELLLSVPGMALDMMIGIITNKARGHFYYTQDHQPLAFARYSELAQKLYNLGLR